MVISMDWRNGKSTWIGDAIAFDGSPKLMWLPVRTRCWSFKEDAIIVWSCSMVGPLLIKQKWRLRKPRWRKEP